MKAFVAFGISALLFLMSIVSIFKIVTNPSSFVLTFTLAALATLVGLAYWNGPQDYIIKIFQKKHLIQTIGLFGSMILALWVSLVMNSYILSLVFTVLEFNFLMLFFFNTFPLKSSLRELWLSVRV